MQQISHYSPTIFHEDGWSAYQIFGSSMRSEHDVRSLGQLPAISDDVQVLRSNQRRCMMVREPRFQHNAVQLCRHPIQTNHNTLLCTECLD